MPDAESVRALINGVGVLGGGVGAGRGLTRLLGPSVDEISTALARWTSFRVGNVERIAAVAHRKAGEREGEVHPRVVHRLLEEGSYCDDELMAEYLGGVLAGSRTPGGRDDRAVAWSDIVTGLSALQVRAHYLIYRELAVLLHGRSDVQLAVEEGRQQSALVLPWSAFVFSLTSAVEGVVLDDVDGVLTHTVPGLVRAGLLGDGFGFGEAHAVVGMLGIPPELVNLQQVLVVRPSFAGLELYGWAQGLPGLSPRAFLLNAQPFELDPPIPLLGGQLPLLPPAPDGSTASTDEGTAQANDQADAADGGHDHAGFPVTRLT